MYKYIWQWKKISLLIIIGQRCKLSEENNIQTTVFLDYTSLLENNRMQWSDAVRS